MTGAQNGSIISGKAFTVTQATPFKARLLVRDQQNGKTSPAVLDFTVTPPSDGGEYPAYVPNKQPPYQAGEIVSNKGANYACKPFLPAAGARSHPVITSLAQEAIGAMRGIKKTEP